MRTRRILIAALLFSLFQTAPAATGATEGDSADRPAFILESPITQTPAESARSDLELAAELDGISVEEAAEVQAARDVLSSIIAELERVRPGAVTGSVSPTIDLPGILYVHGTLSLPDRKRIEDLGIIVSDGQPLSMQDVKNQRATVASALTDAGIMDFTIHGPPDGSAILVTLRDADANLTAATLALPPDIENKISLRISDGLPGEQEAANGGLQLEPACTSGFTTVVGSTTGVSTAAHCLANSPLLFRRDGTAIPYVVGSQHNGQYGDMAWLSTADIEPATFYATYDEVRQVNGVKNPQQMQVGEVVCVFGMTTIERRCAHVLDTSVSCLGKIT